MTNFAQPVSMECTEEQYNRDLKDGLEKLGYEEEDTDEWQDPENCFITNAYSSIGFVGNAPESCIRDNNEYLIDHYNPSLFLAIAGMREGEDVHLGEYVTEAWDKAITFVKVTNDKFANKSNWRKATLQELINHFTKKDMIYTLEDLRQGKVVCVNDGSLEQLRKVLEYCFPEDSQVVMAGTINYMRSKIYPSKWTGSLTTELPTQSVKLFHSQLPKDMSYNQNLFNYIADLTGHNCLVTEMQEIENIVLSEPKEHGFKFGDKVLVSDVGDPITGTVAYFVCIGDGDFKYLVTDCITNLLSKTDTKIVLRRFKKCTRFPEPLKITRSEIAEWKGTDHFEIVD